MSDPFERLLWRLREHFRKLVEGELSPDAGVEVLGRPLTAEEAIGAPGRRDFPIQRGKERVLEAIVDGARGHAFTDSAREFSGTLAEVLDLPLATNSERAVFVATLNAVLARLELAGGTVHCRDDEPGRCGKEIARRILAEHGQVRVGLIGLNPAIAEGLSKTFGAENIRITDLSPSSIGTRNTGVEVWDGATRMANLVDGSDVVLVTGTSLVNDTFDTIWRRILKRSRVGIVFGVTGAGLCTLTGAPRLCPFGRDGWPAT